MRDLTLLDQFRVREPWVLELYGSYGGRDGGAFYLQVPSSGRHLRVIAGKDDDWEHVSVSLDNRTPNWGEMEHVKRMFFKDDECVMQLHVPIFEHINCHPYCLHLWRPVKQPIPRPPKHLV